ncbi:MAG: hypothetical protein A2358_00915 [Candidatus Staskawiczbacteria bacterium RIFOXYB1_FULL_37_44]|uniref:Glycosyltransferase RgtA/B/C/D-like domain-containing protein n=1 Tax=Candidatus Staskawiczbacteria bacterium RIFOXYB1_FULL_37_44 TaxID=1802223 RepID=A0A1G2IV63_9BACT|nr:MAG: hypothetical protein A2358_00915 [Candidatus Staskawiczbacteria bacterium RIFOXYB1_FULL_37_44]OGZ82912.1 MAG: hypothetical protein A2416_02860 [Candidatus Staskawiczbacteria bacterium RIFOXYC1_FULL_37_52]OGZ88626.1 MAG: hypothetical protein A2581_01625 [Candidatus Staskawiczbacteria bacterium RIFOXYD1_FULL_37_110]
MIKFAYFLLYFIIFQILLAIFTQFFGIFYFWVVLPANLFFILALLYVSLRGGSQADAAIQSHPKPHPKPLGLTLGLTLKPQRLKADWVFFAVAIISVLTLYQVHYNYSGEYGMVNDRLFQYRQAKNMQYVYPYFSDEWYAVSLVKESINSHSLPLKNPFDNSFFPNLEIFFHSFIAEIMLLFKLDPLTQYAVLSIFFNALIIVLAYLLLRINNVSKFSSAAASLSILYIASSSNLPGIWNLLPFTMGIILFLIGGCFFAEKNIKMTMLSFLFGALFYPPLIIFFTLPLLFNPRG